MKSKKAKTRKSKTTKRKNRTVIKKAQRVVVLNRAKKKNSKKSAKKAVTKTRRRNRGLDFLAGPQRTVHVGPGVTVRTRAWTEGGAARKARRKAKRASKNTSKKAAPVRRRNKPARISEADISKFPPRVQRQLRAQLGQIEKREVKAKTPTQKKAVAKSRRSFLARLGTRLRLIGQTKKIKVSARDLGRCPRKAVRVRARHETDALAKAQSKLGRGFDQFKVGNPRKPAKKAKKRVTARSPRKSGRSRQKRNSGPAVLALVNQTSPTARAQRKEFAGVYRKDTPLRFPEGTPAGIFKLGRLVKIKTESATVRPADNRVWLCADLQGKFHIGTQNKDGVIWNGQAENFGRVLRIEYEDVKKHLGYERPTQFYHFMGEEDGIKPTLHADGKGGLKFRGGNYKITPEGVVN